MKFENSSFQKVNFSSIKLSENLKLTQQQNTTESQILAKICHQLLNPLNVISFSNSLIQRNLETSNKEVIISCVKNIQNATEEINQTLNKIGLFLEIENKKNNLEITSVNLLKFCQDIIKKLQIIYKDKKIKITIKGNCSAVHIYQPLLEPILDNLLDNALKYSPSNSVVYLIIYCQHKKITFTIKDQGIGISTFDKKQLFQPFYRGQNAKHIPGSGLGLSIVKNLVDLYQGEISVVSQVGFGTTVTLVIPSIYKLGANTS